MCLCPASGLPLHTCPVATILPQDGVPDRVSPGAADLENRQVWHPYPRTPRILTHLFPVRLSFTLCQDLQGQRLPFLPHSALLRPKTAIHFLSLLADSIHTIRPLTQSLAYTLCSFLPLDIPSYQLSKTTAQYWPSSSKTQAIEPCGGESPTLEIAYSWSLTSAGSSAPCVKQVLQDPMNHPCQPVPGIASIPFCIYCSKKIAAWGAESMFWRLSLFLPVYHDGEVQ